VPSGKRLDFGVARERATYAQLGERSDHHDSGVGELGVSVSVTPSHGDFSMLAFTHTHTLSLSHRFVREGLVL